MRDSLKDNNILKNIGEIHNEFQQSLGVNISNISEHVSFLIKHGDDLNAILTELEWNNSWAGEISAYFKDIIWITKKLSEIILEAKDSNDALKASLESEKMKNLELRRKLTEQSQLIFIDKLTGAGTYHKYSKDLEEKLSLIGKWLSLVAFEIDNIEQIGKFYGHWAKERILVAFTQYLKNFLTSIGKNKDFVYIFENFKFFIIIDESLGDIKDKLENLKKDISSRVLNYKKEEATPIKIKVVTSWSWFDLQNSTQNFTIEDTVNKLLDLLQQVKQDSNNTLKIIFEN